MKSKKKQRAYRCTDTLHAAVEAAAKKEDMSVNEWTLYAIRYQLKEGVAGGDPVDLESVGELAKAHSVDKLTEAIDRANKVFEATRIELGITEE